MILRIMKSPRFELLALGVVATCLQTSAATFGDDAAFLKQHADIVVLSDRAKQAEVIVSPAWQGRVLTSTAQGEAGTEPWMNKRMMICSKRPVKLAVGQSLDSFSA